MNSMPHLSTATPTGLHQHLKDDTNNGDLGLSSPTKARHSIRNQRINPSFDKTTGTNGYNLPMRGGSFSSRLDQAMYSRHTPSKQRNYTTPRSTYHDANGGDLYLNGAQDENTYYYHQHQQQQQQQPPNVMSSTQRLNGSTFDITASRKPILINKSNTFNGPTNGTGHNGNYNSAQELHRSEPITDKNNSTRVIVKGTTSKEQLITTLKYRQTSSIPAAGGTTTTANIPDERQPSARSQKSRDANISYAYTNVKKYIEENDLMTPEKEQSIRKWIVDVEKYRNQFEKLE
jgi:hypothetical protein